MPSQRLARRYAIAVFSAAAESDAIARVGDDLAFAARTLRDDALARDFFVAPVVERADKERVVRRAFEGSLHEVALHALLLLVRKRRERLLDEIVAEYRELERTARNTRAVVITCAQPLEPSVLDRLLRLLEETYGTRFEPNVHVDPSVIGGIRLTFADTRIDDTVAGRLERLAHTLLLHPTDASLR